MAWAPRTLDIAGTRPAVIADALRAHMSPQDFATLLHHLGCGVSAAPAVTANPPPVTRRSALAVQAEAIYASYPRRTAKAAALKAIEKALGKVGFDELLAAVNEYAASPAGKQGEFTPHPATWFNREQWNDDRDEWKRERSSGRGKAEYKPGPGERFDPNHTADF